MSKTSFAEDYGCNACWPSDPDVAYSASQRLRRVARLIDESHFQVGIRACAECGQTFLAVFTETIDWSDGDDPQYWTLLPIRAEESGQLISGGESVTEEAINALGRERRCLQHDHPKGNPARTSWGLGFFVGPHD